MGVWPLPQSITNRHILNSHAIGESSGMFSTDQGVIFQTAFNMPVARTRRKSAPTGDSPARVPIVPAARV